MLEIVNPVSSGNRNVRKFSVLAGTNTEFVHYFRSKANGLWYVSCQSGLCSWAYAKKYKSLTLQTADHLCPHLSLIKENLGETDAEIDLEKEMAVVEPVENLADDGYGEEQNLEVEDEEDDVDDTNGQELVQEWVG